MTDKTTRWEGSSQMFLKCFKEVFFPFRFVWSLAPRSDDLSNIFFFSYLAKQK